MYNPKFYVAKDKDFNILGETRYVMDSSVENDILITHEFTEELTLAQRFREDELYLIDEESLISSEVLS